MNVRDRAYFATSALVYTGPLYAGLSGFGLNIVPVFAVIFMLWLYVIRPLDWPQTPEAWRNPRALAWPLLIFLIQIVLVTFCLTIGRGIAGITEFQPPFPLTLSILISLLGIATARLLQPVDAKYAFRGPGQELGIGAGVLDIGIPEMPGQPAEAAFVEGVLMHLADLGPGPAPREAIAEVVTAVEKSGMGAPVVKALADARGDTIIHAQAQAMLALSPGIARSIVGTGVISKSLTRAVSTHTPQIIEDTVQDALTLIDLMPDIAAELPDETQLNAAAKDISQSAPKTYEALQTLRTSIAALTQQNS